jgi:hypothetical protein
MIEARRTGVRLSFIHGSKLDDPTGVLCGRAKAKRYVDVGSMAAARDPAIAALIRCAARGTRAAANTN